MSPSAEKSSPMHELTWSFPISEDGSLNLNEAPTADLVKLAAAVLAVVAERRSEAVGPEPIAGCLS